MRTSFEESILDQMRTAVYVLDEKQHYVYVNNAYANLLGMTDDEIIGHHVRELKEQGNYDICISDYVFKEKRNVSVFSNITVDNGITIKKKRYLVRATPLFDETGKVSGMYATCEAIDDIRKSISEANSRSIFAQTLNITHSIRTAQTDIQIIAESDAMRKVVSDAANIANVDATVLLTGETGTGKELMAQYIHKMSRRRDKRMVTINCAALPENILESTLFGYEKGAFTGALSTGKQGLIEAANGSTLFLDEINSMSLRLQGEFLRTLESHLIQPVGSVKEIPVDFRLIAATNMNLKQLVEEGTFREDLFYRLNVLPMTLPPLRNRKEDIIPLLHFFTDRYSNRYQKVIQYSDEAINCLQEETWPGNIRELRNLVERITVMCDHGIVTKDDLILIMGSMDYHAHSPEKHLTSAFREHEQSMSLDDYLDTCEKEFVRDALERHGSTYKAAKALNTSQSRVSRAKRKYRL